MNIGILAVGDEILIGQIVNKNASWIADACTQVGAAVEGHCVVGDNIEAIASEVIRLAAIHDVVIMTGGLGPTHDDVTHEAIARLSAHPRQLKNPVGSASALEFVVSSNSQLKSTTVFALPGVPREMEAIMQMHVIPFVSDALRKSEGTSRQYLTLHTTGIPESVLAERIGDVAFLGSSSLAFLPSYFGVRLRIGVSGRSELERDDEISRIREYITERVGTYIIGEGSTSLVQILAQRLIDRKETVAVAESCTGGMLGEVLTSINGSSAWFNGGIISYSNEAKTSLLGVNSNTLEQYGAVSDEVVREMCSGARNALSTSWGIGITGIAGPDGGTIDKPVGLVWIGIAGPDGVTSKKFQFGTDRQANRERSVGAAMMLLLMRTKQ